jgi:Flp pilus assembly protein CpaB
VNPRRIIILIVAVAVGALAAAGLLSYVRAAQTSADEAAAPVEVWIIQQPIPKGTTVEQALALELLALDRTAQEYRPATAVTDPATELAGLVAVVDLPVGAPLVAGLFASPRQVDTGITDRLNATGLVTVTLQVDLSRGVANLIEPGDFVNVFILRQWDTDFFEQDPAVELTPEAEAELQRYLTETNTRRPVLDALFPRDPRVVYQKAEVLAVGQEVVPDLGETATETPAAEQVARGIVTLAVPPEAMQVLLGLDRDLLYLSLVPDDYEPRVITPLDPTRQVLPGELPGQLTPYDGYDGVVDPTLAAGNSLVGDDENRIGVTPGSSSTDPGEAEAGGENGAATSEDPDEGNGGETGDGTTTTTEPDGQ